MGIVGSIVIFLAASAAGRYAYTFIRPSLFGGTGTVAWQTATPPGANYDVKLPGPMKTEKEKMQMQLGSLTAYWYSCEVEGQGFAGVANVDYPIEHDLAVDDIALLDGAVKGSLERSRSTLVSRRDIQLPGGYRGVEVEMLPPKDMSAEISVTRIYWVRPRVYIQMLAAKRDSQLWKERDVFLTSFELKK